MERSLENKIMHLEAQFRAGKEASQRDNLGKDLTVNALCSPRHGSGRRPKDRAYLITKQFY